GGTDGPRDDDHDRLPDPDRDLGPRRQRRARPRGEVVVPMKKVCLAALLVLAGCASGPRPREFKLTADGFRTEGADWLLDPVESDRMMPDGWERVPGTYQHATVVAARCRRVRLG